MPSSRDIKTDFKGLVTAPGLFVRAESSCIEADNMVLDAPGVMRKRRGFKALPGSTGGPAWKVFSSRQMGDKLLTHAGANYGTNLFYGDGSVALTTVPMVATSSLTRTDNATRMSMAMCGKNHYVTAKEGVARIESGVTTATNRFAGMPRGIGPLVYFGAWGGWVPLGAGTLLASGYARGYRVTWHRKDTDGVELGGAPTGRAVIRNQAGTPGFTGATMNGLVRFLVPRELSTLNTQVTTSWYWRLWGTRTWNSVGGEQGDDECYLIAENYVTAAQLAAGVVLYTDSTPDSYLVRQRRLHTNTQNFPDSELGIRQGTLNEDAPPPVADDIAYWADVMWYAGLKYRPRATLRLLSVGGSGLVAGDTITIQGPTGVSVNVAASNAPAANTEFQVYTTFATTALNLEATCMDLVETINYNAVNAGFRAYYVSVGNSAPGQILLESLLPEAAVVPGLLITVSRPAAFSLVTAAGVASSSIDEQPNGVAFSKPGRADAVPPINTFTVGPADSRILRIHPYRDRLLVFTDQGIYQVTGNSYADFTLSPFDLSFRLLSRESVVTCDDRVYAWCYEGIIEISNSGADVISVPIEPTLTDIINTCGGVTTGQSTFATLSFAVAYRNQHRVMFFYPEAAADPLTLMGCSRWLVWDTRTRMWTSGSFAARIGDYTDNRSAGVVRFSDDLLMLGCWSTGADTYLFKERRSLTAADYVDTARDLSDYNISSTIRFQFQVPDIEGAVHWQQTTLQFEGGEFIWRPYPSAVDVLWYSPTAGVNGAGGVTGNTLPAWRAEPPTAIRRSQRLQLVIAHASPEYFGLNGVTQSVRLGTRFLGRGES